MVVISVVVIIMAEGFIPDGHKPMTFMEKHGHGWGGKHQRGSEKNNL